MILIPVIYKIIKKNVELGFYDSVLLEDYTEEEWNEINDFIKYDRDFNIAYVGMEQFRGKYSLKIV